MGMNREVEVTTGNSISKDFQGKRMVQSKVMQQLTERNDDTLFSRSDFS